MGLSKVFGYSKYLPSIIQATQLMPRCQFSRCYSKAYTYYAGFEANALKQKRRKQTLFMDEKASQSEKLTIFKDRLKNLVDPIQKYEFLIRLRDYDIDLYYRYLCNNTAQALSVICAIHDIQKGNAIFISSHLGLRRMEIPMQLDADEAVQYMKEKVDIARQTKTNKFSDAAIQIKCQEADELNSHTSTNKIHTIWEKKGLMITPEHSYIIYMKDKTYK